MPKLRFFLYLDDEIVSQFLSQVEGGEFDDQRIKDQRSGGSGVGGSLTVGPLSGHADRTKGDSSEAEFTMRQTGPSRFNRLHRALTEDGLAAISGVDDEIWSGFEVGEILEVSVQPDVPALIRQAAQVGDAAKLAPLVDLMHEIDSLGIPGAQFDAASRQTMKEAKRLLPTASSMSEVLASSPVPCVFSLTDSPDFKMFAYLDRTKLLVDLPDLAGEMNLLAKLDRFVAQRKPETFPVLQGLPTPPRAQRRKGGGSTAPTVTMRHPAAVVSPVALYR